MQAWLTLVLAVNAVALLAMGYDKWRAQRGSDRIPEAHLFALAALTGALGIWAGRSLFRHKTIKPGFRTKLILASAVNLLWLGLWWQFAR